MRILVCGGRDFATNDNWSEVQFLYHEMYAITDQHAIEDLVIIHGAASGADNRAGEFARNLGIKEERYPAKWEEYGKRAGYIRNQQMLDNGKPDLVVAFPGGKGTAMMVDIAKKAGVKVIEVKYD